jgi:hypothetical protein
VQSQGQGEMSFSMVDARIREIMRRSKDADTIDESEHSFPKERALRGAAGNDTDRYKSGP